MIEEVRTSTFNIDTPRLRSQLAATVAAPTVVIWLMLSLLFLAIGYYFQRVIFAQERAAFEMVMFVAAPIYLALLFGWSAYKNTRASMQRVRNAEGASLYRCTFSPSRLGFENDAGAKSEMPYHILFQVMPEPTGIMIKVDRLRFLWVPSEAFSSKEEFDQACKWCSKSLLGKSDNEKPSMR